VGVTGDALVDAKRGGDVGVLNGVERALVLSSLRGVTFI
jgi:hypothetical protein